MFLQKIIHSKLGSYAIAIIFGLGLASLFRPACNGEGCYEFVGPPNNEVKDGIYKFNEQCYSFKAKATTCNKNMKTLRFSTLENRQKETNTKPKSMLTRMIHGSQ
jgi:uncharacterized protein with FMN-binding domain